MKIKEMDIRNEKGVQMKLRALTKERPETTIVNIKEMEREVLETTLEVKEVIKVKEVIEVKEVKEVKEVQKIHIKE